ncbi:MAG TPA: site-specific DNA-methyltransferase [Lacipirellulaceae bacterium]|nr:site-specific DNA-methyltransferase [Lacipirellulaceae bacterium]
MNGISPELYRTVRGKQIVGDAQQVLRELQAESVDLVITSPPFALLRQKSYGNLEQHEYVDWLISFGPRLMRVLKSSGSLVLDLGGAYQRGKPIRSLYNFRVLLRLCDECGFHLAEEFFWHNPAKLPSPIEWVNKRKIRAKDSVNTVWWLSKTENPKADVSKVRTPYSARMKKLLKAPEKFYQPKDRPSGHEISKAFGKDNGGAIPANLLQYSNTESNSIYIRLCKEFGFDAHPARFPKVLPSFFIKFLTEPGDTVLDIFSGSNTTGEASEELDRNWIGVELCRDYAITSAFRFMADWPKDLVAEYVHQVREGCNGISLLGPQRVLF